MLISKDALLARRIRLYCLLLVTFCLVRFAVSPSFPSLSSIIRVLPSFGNHNGPENSSDSWWNGVLSSPYEAVDDEHPIRQLMNDADSNFEHYERNRSTTFKQTVERYRRAYGRLPPPAFDEWYRFARQRQIYNIDDFQQIHDDLRPFWAASPSDLRHYAAHASNIVRHGISTIAVRNGRAFEGALSSPRSEVFVRMLEKFAAHLPDMDIPMNRMDQPRVVVPWDDLQAALKIEETSRFLAGDGAVNAFTKDMAGFWKTQPISLFSMWKKLLNLVFRKNGEENIIDATSPRYGWFSYLNKPFMDIASQACPPNSYARNPNSDDHLRQAEATYTHALGGFITNHNLSSNLCSVGPQLSHLHGLLYASTSMFVTQNLVPIFSECKTNINNDIIFPANMYYKQDKNFRYRQKHDEEWSDKDDVMFWRGSTSGGNAYEDAPDRWRSMHRQRFVLATNDTELEGTNAAILTLSSNETGTYTSRHFPPAEFATKHTDVAFSKLIACVPDDKCSFYSQTFSKQPWTTLATSFRHKYLVDIDGHSFSGRWRAYLQSRSLALKATIIREWHDSRLQAWRHFVPIDNRYGDLYSLLTYFVGYREPTTDGTRQAFTVPRHDYEARKIATQGRDWAAKVLRREDMEIYMFRLLVEYGRLIDDNRHHIGYVGDGGEEMAEFDRRYPAVE